MKKQYDAVLFDLDGTLTDSSLGIITCAKLALDHYNIEVPMEQMKTFIGPPLRDTFQKYGMNPEEAENAVKIFRARYEKVGKYENEPYDGIEELLKKLKDEGVLLYVATSKPEETAIDILKKFQLAQYFDEIAGASKDKSRDSKSAVIRYLLNKVGEEKQMIMVGDTIFDIEGARQEGLDCIAVTWGFGDIEEMKQQNPAALVHTVEELFTVLVK